MERLVLSSMPEVTLIEDLALPSNRISDGDRFKIDFSGGPIPWEVIERSAIVEALRTARGNVSEAARLLGLGRGALRYRMSRFDLDATGADQEESQKAA
jgi:transcriptional regulator of acetoin/glycerol metabolism